jgi:hypothetical protein
MERWQSLTPEQREELRRRFGDWPKPPWCGPGAEGKGSQGYSKNLNRTGFRTRNIPRFMANCQGRIHPPDQPLRPTHFRSEYEIARRTSPGITGGFCH